MVKYKNAKKGSSLKGVYLCKKTNKYYAMAHCNKEKYIGKLYKNDFDAHEQYKKLLDYFSKNSCKMNRFKVVMKKRGSKKGIKRGAKKCSQKDVQKKNKSIKRPYKKKIIKKESCKRKNLSFSDAYRLAHEQFHLCNICQDELKDGFQLDHIIPLQYGGTNNYTNFQALCNKCHLYKTNRVDNIHIKGIVEQNKNIPTDLIVKICRNSYHNFYGMKKGESIDEDIIEGESIDDDIIEEESNSSFFSSIKKYLPSVFH